MPLNASTRVMAAVAALLVLPALAAEPAVDTASVQQAYSTGRVAEAERMYRGIAADAAATAADRATARRELARIDWLVRGETDAAEAAWADAAPEGRCATLAVVARALTEAGQPQRAVDAAGSRTGCTAEEDERLRLRIAQARLAMVRAGPIDRASHLDAAAAEMSGIDPVASGTPAVASTRLALATARSDAPAALRAWRDYFWLGERDAPSALPEYAGRVGAVFEAGLAPEAPEASKAALADLLIKAGFGDEAALIPSQREGPDWQRARAYLEFRGALRKLLLALNRSIAGDSGQDHLAALPAFERAYRDLVARLMASADLQGDPDATLERVYGLHGTPPSATGGYPGLHLGHLVQDEVMQVSQYGREGEVRFIVIDNMLANGYLSWLWDGSAEVGGWAAAGNAIVQVRPAYTGGPLGDLRRTRPGAVRRQFEADIERELADERALLARDGVAALPAMGKRLRLQALDQIAALAGSDDSAFMAEIWRAINQASIEAHEGRHALDQRYEPGHSPSELEYRGKLSEIAFADYPRLGLSNVVRGLHDDTQHGIANRQALQGLRRWMRRHRGEIRGYDRSQPELSQLDKLTDAQVVAAARSLDPWARRPRRRRLPVSHHDG